ncbi:MAG TPA: hypothetical protein VGL40_06925 [Bacillota bacterium]
MPTVNEVRTWLAGRLSTKLGPILPEIPGLQGILPLGLDEILIVEPTINPYGRRTWSATSLQKLAESYQAALPAGVVLQGRLAGEDFTILRDRLIDSDQRSFLDRCRAEGLI